MLPMEGSAPAEQAAPSEPGIDPDEQAILDSLQDILRDETDAARQQKLAKIIAELSALMAEEEDAQIKLMGGEPKQMRAMGRAYSGGQ